MVVRGRHREIGSVNGTDPRPEEIDVTLRLQRKATSGAFVGLVGSALVASMIGTTPPALASAVRSGDLGGARTPIDHVIVIVGENHSFDNVFGTYHPSDRKRILNLRSEGIVKVNGTLGRRSVVARQRTATDTATTPGQYTLRPPLGAPYAALPAPNTTYISSACDGGLPQNSTDSRFPARLPNGPFQITRYVPYFDAHPDGKGCVPGAYVGDPIHRFYQMWQQVHGGGNDLFTWTGNTAGYDNGAVPPKPIYQGGLQMGYYNMQQGDAPTLKFIASHYSMSDNYHQAIMGGTGANHIAIGTGFAAGYYNAQGQPAVPPLDQIENPNPKAGTNNNFTQDGYSGGSYSDCADPSAPGVSAISNYLGTLPYRAVRNCEPGTYYLLNNYLPGYTVTGQRQTGTFVVPPQPADKFPTIGDELTMHGLSWRYYGQGWNNGHPTSDYCSICDPFQYATSIMTNSAQRKNITGMSAFYQNVSHGWLPNFSIVKPAGPNDGHPGYSTLASFERFVAQVSNSVIRQPKLFGHTAIFVTFDEGGGYYDSGYVQPQSFFGDGTRVPFMVISPYTRPGVVNHTYTDHVSLIKFVEANWGLPPLSPRSLDNLPNPISRPHAPYVPVNRPAIGDLMTVFDFRHRQPHSPLIPLR